MSGGGGGMKVSAPDGVKVCRRERWRRRVRRRPIQEPAPKLTARHATPPFAPNPPTQPTPPPNKPQVYHVTSGKTFASWLPEAKRRALRKDDSYRRRLELLQDFGFPAACQRLKLTPDGQYLVATGYHPPQVCETREMREWVG